MQLAVEDAVGDVVVELIVEQDLRVNDDVLTNLFTGHPTRYLNLFPPRLPDVVFYF
jgi:hypothetical protein